MAKCFSGFPFDSFIYLIGHIRFVGWEDQGKDMIERRWTYIGVDSHQSTPERLINILIDFDQTTRNKEMGWMGMNGNTAAFDVEFGNHGIREE